MPTISSVCRNASGRRGCRSGTCGSVAGAVVVVLGCVALLLTASSVAAQLDTDRQRIDGPEAVESQIRVMEQAFEQAVGRGVRTVEQQLPSLVPGLLFLAGSIQVRGFALEGYGLFFDVEYPAVRRSMLWSMAALSQFDASMANALANLHRQMQTMPDGPRRTAFSEALRELEARARSTSPTPVALGAADRSQGRAVDDPSTPDPVDPLGLDELYRVTLTKALTDVLVTYGRTIPPGTLGAEHWLTVAARDGRGLAGSTAERRTLQIGVRGRDLAALRDGRLSLDDLRARVETR